MDENYQIQGAARFMYFGIQTVFFAGELCISAFSVWNFTISHTYVYAHTHTVTLTSNLLHILFNGYIYVYSQQPHFAIFSEFINVYKRIAVIRCVRWWYMVSIWLCWILWIKIFRCAMLFLPLLLTFSLVANNFRIDFACIHLNKCFFLLSFDIHQ